MARKLDYQPGGLQQIPLFQPESTWTRLTELPDLRALPEWGIDTETRDDGLSGGTGPGWVYRRGYITGVSIAWDTDQSAYLPIQDDDTDCFPKDQLARWLHDHRHLRWVFQNAPYDLGWMRTEFGLTPPDKIDDTTAMSVMLDEWHQSYKLDDIAARCGVPGKDERLLKAAAAAWGYNPKTDMYKLPARFKGDYAAADALATLRAARVMRPMMEVQELGEAYELEMQLIPMIQEMRVRGIRVDEDAAERAKVSLLRQRDAVFAELKDKLNERVTMVEIGRTAWLQRVFDKEGISYPHTVATSRYPQGQPSFTAGSTGWMHKHPHWLPQLIVRADKLNNAATKFIQGFILDYAHNGRIHASINQFMTDEDDGKKGARTFRFSYSDPALQQMPSRDDELKEIIRGCFVPEPGELWGRIDYEQQEFRLIVHFARLSNLRKADEAAQKYIDDPATDFHQLVSELTGLERKPAKDTNFAKAYGAGVPKFAEMTNMSLADAEKIMTQYDEEMPFVQELNDKCKSLAARRGYIRLIDGARMHFPFWEGPWMDWGERNRWIKAGVNINPGRLEVVEKRREDPNHPWHGVLLRRADTRTAMNGLIQGSAARQTKRAMLLCWKENLVPLLQIHDELNFSCASPGPGDRAAKLMRDAMPLVIPMGADVEWGTSWARAVKNKKKGYGATWDEAWTESLLRLQPAQ